MIIVKVPSVGESISEVSLLKWRKQNGEFVKRDEVIAELESEKATFELNADQAGTLTYEIKEGDTLKIGDTIAHIDDSAPMPVNVPNETPVFTETTIATTVAETRSAPTKTTDASINATPLAKEILTQEKISPTTITGTGAGGKIKKSDVLENLLQQQAPSPTNNRSNKREKLSQLRKVISRRLVEAKNTTAMLTTFNEIDMTAIMAIRTKYKDAFKKAHDVNLGFMSFFTKACTIALQEYPAVNSLIDGDEIQYHDYTDISIAVSAPKGLVVPVIRNAESLSMAGIEKAVIVLATKAKENKLTMEEMTGGTFTITNGGVFGSLMSTPIINLPQAAILGMHKIQDRPMAINGQVLIRPMMYVALSYDHRIIDGRESVGFLVRVKELLENPEQLFTRKDPIKYVLDI